MSKNNFNHSERPPYQREKIDLEEAKKAIWKILQYLFFTGNKREFKKLIQESDTSGKFWALIKYTDSDSEDIDRVVELVSTTIRRKFETDYSEYGDVTEYI